MRPVFIGDAQWQDSGMVTRSQRVVPTPDGGGAAPETSALGATRRRLLRTLQEAGSPVTIEDLSARMNLHPNTLRFHLMALIDSGLVLSDTERRTTQGRPRRLYSAAPASPTIDADHYRELAGAFVRHLAASSAGPDSAEALGADWGRLLAQQQKPGSDPLAELTAAVQRLGFASRTDTAGERPVITITRCPYLDLARQDSTVCVIHRGIIDGYLHGCCSPLVMTELEPWATENSCRATFGPR